jgi:hypothetical protein
VRIIRITESSQVLVLAIHGVFKDGADVMEAVYEMVALPFIINGHA